MADYTDAQLATLDRAIATEVMGWRPDSTEVLMGDTRDFHPTRDSGQAMQVLERCKEWMFVCWGNWARVGGYQKNDGGRTVRHQPAWTAGEMDWSRGVPVWYEAAPTPMLAICLAAARKHGIEV